MRVILASASPARLATLQRAGLRPEVIISGVPEDGVPADSVSDLVAELAQRKAETVYATLEQDADVLVIGCDSMLELHGEGLGKPRSAAEAAERWRRMSGSTGVLHTGHHVIMTGERDALRRTATASTVVRFARLIEAEIGAYVGTGEPLLVAGAFTIDGLGGPFISGIDGDHHNVVGISLPLLRTMIADLGVLWPSLWAD